MNFKKLIGTIIGVTLFAVLIAGATFAWLTFGTTIVSNNINAANTMNFLVDYTKGTAIDNIPMVDSTLVTPKDTASLVVVMKRHNNSPDGHGYVSLNTVSGDNADASKNTLTTKGIVRWAICRDTDIEATGNQIDDVCGDASTTAEFTARALNTGKVTGKGTTVLLNDAKLQATKCTIDIATATTCTSIQAEGGSATQTAQLPTSTGNITASSLIPPTLYATSGKSEDAGVSYFVYFWLDGETISNSEKEQTYTGYIQAGANQLQS